MTYSYTDPAHKQAVTGISGGMSASYSYGQRGNMLARTVNNLTYTQTFDVEGRLDSVTVGGQMTTFTYDDAGNRVLAVYNSGTIQATNVYTPFPDYEVEDPPTGDNITRTTYRLAGQMVAVQKRVGAGAGTFAYTYTDHLGNLVALSSLTGVLDATSLARYDPFGNYRTTPATNPGMTDHGFTGHRHNNTGTNNLGLIYMNARYYLPEVGRFISADSIVPEPGEPQSYNRYSYVRNSPMNFTDPTGHRECLDSNLSGCLRIASYEPPPADPIGPPPPEPMFKEWEAQLLAMVAFVETHGHGNEQASAIIRVILNRFAGLTSLEGNRFYPNSNFSTQSMIAGYVLNEGQTELGNEMVKYGLLELNGNYRLVQGLDLEGAVAQAYDILNDAYHNAVELLLKEIVNPLLESYSMNGLDPTSGSIYYWHMDEAEAEKYEIDVLIPRKANNERFNYEVFPSTRPINPRSLIVSN